MKLFVALFALVAVAAAQVTNEYLPPNYGGDADPSEVSYSVADSAPAASYDTGASAPAHSYSAYDGYRYKTHRRRVFKTSRRHRRGVSTDYLPPAASSLSNEYLAPAASVPSNDYLAPAFSAPGATYSVEATAPAASYESYGTAGTAPAHSYSDAEGYRYKTNRRRVFKTSRRHRRGVSTDYLPPAASSLSNAYLAPAASVPSNDYLAPAVSAPGVTYSVEASAPAASYESYETAGTAPAHSYSDAEGYRYKTNRRRVFKTSRRHRRGVSTDYLPPAESAAAATYAEPAASYSSASYSTPSGSYTVEAAAPGGVQETYETAASAPAHSFSNADGYRYKTVRRRVIRRNRF